MRRGAFALVLVFLFVFGSGFGRGRPTPLPSTDDPAPPFSQPSFKRVLIVVLENTNADDALKQPFLGKLAAEGAYLSTFYAVTHPSQPNYLAMTAGSYFGVKNDANVTLDVRSIADLLEEHGKSWKAYAEGYPGNCFLGKKQGHYYRKHVPFLSFKSIQNDPERCANVVDGTELDRDIAQGTLPDYAIYVPDIDDDGHDTGVGYSDAYMARRFGPLLEDPRFTKDLLLVVTFDESASICPRKNHIYTVLYGDSVVPGRRVDYPYNFYSLLRTIEEAYGLGTLGQNDAGARAIGGVWR